MTEERETRHGSYTVSMVLLSCFMAGDRWIEIHRKRELAIGRAHHRGKNENVSQVKRTFGAVSFYDDGRREGR